MQADPCVFPLKQKLGAHLLPHVSGGVVGEHIEAVVGAKRHSITAGVKSACSELAHSLISAVVKALERAPVRVIEHHLRAMVCACVGEIEEQ